MNVSNKSRIVLNAAALAALAVLMFAGPLGCHTNKSGSAEAKAGCCGDCGGSCSCGGGDASCCAKDEKAGGAPAKSCCAACGESCSCGGTGSCCKKS